MAFGINPDALRQGTNDNLRTMIEDMAKQRSTSSNMANSALDREMDKQKLEQQARADQERLRLEDERIRSQEDMQRERIDAERQAAIQSLVAGMLGQAPTTSRSGGSATFPGLVDRGARRDRAKYWGEQEQADIPLKDRDYWAGRPKKEDY